MIPPQKRILSPVKEVLKFAKACTGEFHSKSKKCYDRNYVDPKFKVRDLVNYAEFHYPNIRKLSQVFTCAYIILKKISAINVQINRETLNKNTEIDHVSKLREYYLPDKLKLSIEQQQTNVKSLTYY